jgi:hypothetical protein
LANQQRQYGTIVQRFRGNDSPMMEAERAPETLGKSYKLTQLVAREDSVAFSRRESFKSCMLYLLYYARSLHLSTDRKCKSSCRELHSRNATISFNFLNDLFFAEFHGLDTEVMVKILQTLEASKKSELFNDNQGVKFF